MTAPDSSRIIFLHMPKTGGLTLRHFLLQQYRDAAFDHQDHWTAATNRPQSTPPPDRGQNERYLDSLSALPDERQARVRVYIGHFIFGIHERLPGPSTYITLVRDPIDRALSGYQYRLDTQGFDLPLRDFVMNGHSASNLQTRCLAGGSLARAQTCTSETLDAAKQHLTDHFAVAGITERWDETLLVLADTFGWDRPYYKKYNESQGRPTREMVDDDMLEILHEQNRFDLELHRFASERFEDRLARDHPDIEEQVFQRRRRNRRWQRVQRAKRIRYLLRSTAARTYHRVRGR